MLDFLLVKHRKIPSKGIIEVYPDFLVSRSKDLMVRGGEFYAIWNYETKLWSTDEYDVRYLVDKLLKEYAKRLEATEKLPISIKLLSNYSSGSWSMWRLYISKLSDHSVQLDRSVTFSNTIISKADFVSRKLDYPIEEGSTEAFDSLFTILYSETELEKILWAIGAIVSGNSKNIQKFFVLFGPPGSGKSTALNLIQMLFPGYFTSFEAQTLTSGSSAFPTEIFRANPLIGINHEGDLSKVRDNSILNSIVAHDMLTMNVKYQHSYSLRLNTMLFIATNKAVSITDANSGLIRRLVDIRPSGNKVSPEQYDILMSQIKFELGAISHKALSIFNRLGKEYYSRYKPLDMMLRTNVVYNFVDHHYYDFVKENHVTLSRAWEMYKEFCELSDIVHHLSRYKFRDELKAYWGEFHPYKRMGNKQYRSLFEGFKVDMFSPTEEVTTPIEVNTSIGDDWLEMSEQPSILDIEFANCPAQYGSDDKGYMEYWDNVDTTLSDLNTKSLHYVRPLENHIFIDFDIKDEYGNKSLEKNLAAARLFPPTYAETSKGGQGLHLHYYWGGEDISNLSRIYDEGIEVKLPIGKASVRRKLSVCNDLPISTINTGLPVKEDPQMISEKVVKSERSLRTLIIRNLNKDIHPATKPSVDFIKKILEDAVKNGLSFDVSDMKPAIINFASNSTNHSTDCIQIALNLPYSNESELDTNQSEMYNDDRLVFYDVEVFPNLFLICWKFEGETQKTRMFNPSPEDVGNLLRLKLVGFNNRRYDNHILYGRYLGFSEMQLYKLSKRIIEGDRSALFREAYRVSHTDVYDYSSEKKSLKKWQLALGLEHKELDLPWDEPVPEDKWDIVADYCDNDVETLEQLHNTLLADYNARLILSEISGLTPNDSTLSHTTRIVFGKDKNPQRKFNYVDLSKEFPGYTFHRGVSTYRGEEVGEGGYNYSEPGVYKNVLYMDIASMHPTSIEVMNLFGPYTKNYTDIKNARLAIKHGDLDAARSMFGGRLKKYIDGDTKALAYALKIIINIVYGVTFASFPNAFKDPRNIDNVVAKRGALFMVDLKHALQDKGISAVHFKTDSVKIANYKKEDIDFIKNFGKKYGYTFEVENIFEKMALVNKADLIAKTSSGKWEAVGATFARPYVFKNLFSKEKILFEDMVEDRAVTKGSMYIDFGDGNLMFIGRAGSFCPVHKSKGGLLLRINDGKRYSVADTKGYHWLPSYMVKGNLEEYIDMEYFKKASNDAISKISDVGDATYILEKKENK